MWLLSTADNAEGNCWKQQLNIGGMKNNDTYVIHVLGLFFRSLQWLLLASYNTYNGHFDLDFFFFSPYSIEKIK